jgi:ABC-2 type transport system permease protein/sodium transport system permease protein
MNDRRTSTTLARLGRLVLKELREVFRDRRTIITLVVMPVLIYPLLALVFQRFLLTSLAPEGGAVYLIGVETELDVKNLVQQLQAGQDALDRTTRQRPAEMPKLSWSYMRTDEISRRVAQSEIHLGMIVQRHGGETSRAGLAAPLSWEIIYRAGMRTSEEALHFVEERLTALNRARMDEQLRQLGVTAVLPAAIIRTPIQVAGAPIFSLAALIPLILVLTTMTGAVYPAIDLTAGERERGTLEMLIAAPVPRLGLLLAKYVAVLAVALLTAVVNLIGMTLTAQGTGLAGMLFGPGGMSPAVVLNVWLLLCLFAAFFSAVLLAITSYARSFKEAQAYIIPLMLVCLVPGVICLLPGLEFTVPLAVTPLVNIVLLARDVLEGDVAGELAAAAMMSTALYVVAAIALAARIFGADAILYGSPATWSDIFRRPAEPQPTASLPAAMFALVLMFPLSFVLAGSLMQSMRIELSQRLIMSGLSTALVFAAIPAAVAAFHRVRLGSGLALVTARPTAWLAAALLGASLWPFAQEAFFVNEWLGISDLNERFAEIGSFARELRRLPFGLVVVTLAIVPGVCEELFFRGFFFGAIRSVLSAGQTVAATAVLFGLLHVVSGNAFLPERFIPSLFLGLFLGWVRLRSGSVLPCMLLHVVHNATLLAIAYWQDELLAAGIGVDEQSHLPIAWLGAAALAVLVAIVALLADGQRRAKSERQPAA